MFSAGRPKSRRICLAGLAGSSYTLKDEKLNRALGGFDSDPNRARGVFPSLTSFQETCSFAVSSIGQKGGVGANDSCQKTASLIAVPLWPARPKRNTTSGKKDAPGIAATPADLRSCSVRGVLLVVCGALCGAVAASFDVNCHHVCNCCCIVTGNILRAFVMSHESGH